MIVVFIAGPFRAATHWYVELNVRRAEHLALSVARLGASPLCPHTNTRFFDGILPDDFWLPATMELMRRCDAVITTKDWRMSSGAIAEVREAMELGKPVFHQLDDLAQWVSESEDK